MIINGFGGNTDSSLNNGWVDIISVPYSGTQTIPTFSCYSSSKTHYWPSTEVAVVWPYVGDYRWVRIKPGCTTFTTNMVFSSGSSYSGTYYLGWICSYTKVTEIFSSSNTSRYSKWHYCDFAFPTSTTVPIGSNMATVSSSQYYITGNSVDYMPVYVSSSSNVYTRFTPTIHDNQMYSGSGVGSCYLTGYTYYFYIYFIWAGSGGSSTDLSFNYSGAFTLQGHR